MFIGNTLWILIGIWKPYVYCTFVISPNILLKAMIFLGFFNNPKSTFESCMFIAIFLLVPKIILMPYIYWKFALGLNQHLKSIYSSEVCKRPNLASEFCMIIRISLNLWIGNWIPWVWINCFVVGLVPQHLSLRLTWKVLPVVELCRMYQES